MVLRNLSLLMLLVVNNNGKIIESLCLDSLHPMEKDTSQILEKGKKWKGRIMSHETKVFRLRRI